jgi:histidine triad (HIT) family protein
MYNHTPKNYICPICLGVQGIENEHTLLLQQDHIYKDQLVSVFINSFWITGNEGHVIIVPNEHYENIYDLPEKLGAHIFAIAKKITLVMKETYKCDGITTLQNNEPAAGQHALHYHFHVFPRYDGDHLHANMTDKQLADPTKRKEYATLLKNKL